MKRAALALLLASCAEPSSCPPADLSPLDAEPAFAFVASDYASSAIGLLDSDGALIREAWIDSGTVAPGLVPALSGDVVLASSPPSRCVVAVIDRSGTDVITFLDACADDDVLLGQIDVGPTFDANPQDLLALDDTRALVSRHEPNLLPSADELERGNDLLVIDWRRGRVLSRVDLSALDVLDGERIYARPGRMVRVGGGEAGAIVVGLARLGEDFMRPGPGAVAIVDPGSLEVSALSLDGLLDCVEVDAVPGEATTAIVTCQGAPFGDSESRREGAGVAAVELGEDGEVHVRATWRAARHPSSPVFNTWSVPLAVDRVVTIAMGDLRARIGDRAGLIELAPEDEAPLLMEAAEAFVLGDGAYDATRGLLLIPDAHEGTIRRFAMGASPVEADPVLAAGCRGLPPREIRRILD